MICQDKAFSHLCRFAATQYCLESNGSIRCSGLDSMAVCLEQSKQGKDNYM